MRLKSAKIAGSELGAAISTSRGVRSLVLDRLDPIGELQRVNDSYVTALLTAQKVQSSPSADGGIYEKSYERAVLVVGALWAEPLCPSA